MTHFSIGHRWLSLLLLYLFAALPVTAQDQAPESPKVALVLAGGGALGYAHVGVLKVLEEEGIVPDMVIGSSMGSIIGGLYCAGYSALEMEAMVEDIDWKYILNDSNVRSRLSFEQKNRQAEYPLVLENPQNFRIQDTGLSHGQHVVEFLDARLQSYPAEMDFDDLPTPFRAVGADLLTGEKVVFSQGDLKTAIRASMAVPGAFTPVEYQNRYIIDGDWVDNLPTRVAREWGADIVVAVSLYTLKSDPADLTTLEAVNYQAFLIRTIERQKESYSAADLVIAPQFSEFSIVDFENAEDLIKKGYAAASEIRGEIAALAKDIGPRESRRNRVIRDPVIPVSEILINGGTDDSSGIREIMLEELGPAPRESDLRNFLYAFYDGGDYSHFWYQLQKDGSGSYRLVIDAPRRMKEQESLSLGLEFSSQLPVSSLSSMTLKAAYKRWFGERKNLSLGVNFRLSSFPQLSLSLHQDLLNRSLAFEGEGHFRQSPRAFYQEGSLESVYSLSAGGGSLSLKLPLFRIVEISGSLYGDRMMLEQREGSALPDSPDWSRFGLRAAGNIDTLDRVIAPQSGLNAVLMLDSSLIPDGDPLGYSLTAGEIYLPLAGKRLILSPRWETLLLHWGSPEILELPAVGETGSFYGFQRQELRGDNVLAAGLDLRVRIASLPLGAGNEIYLRFLGNGAYLWNGNPPDYFDQDNLYRAVAAGILLNTLIGEAELNFTLNDRNRMSLFLGLSSSTVKLPHS